MKTQKFSTVLPAVRVSLVTLFMLLSATVEVAAQCTGPVFAGAPEFVADRRSSSVAVGDFNGDSKPDLALANELSDNVSVLLGDGVGGFGPPANFAARKEPFAIVSADFNKDGKADLAVGHIFGQGLISVLLGNGDGTFGAATDVGSTSNVTGIATADFNNDNNPDLAVSSFGFQLILLGNGSGGFTSNNVTVGSQASAVAVGDFNGDNFKDAAFTTNGSGNWKVEIVFGKAAGPFSVNASFTVSQSPNGIAVGNFNADTQPDILVVGDHSEPRVFLFLNQGGGSFTQSASLFAGRGPHSVTAGDFNGDGKTDAAVGLANADSVFISLGDGLGNLATPNFYGTGSRPLSIATADFNADSKLDLVTANSASSTLALNDKGGASVLLGTGTGAFQSYRAYVYPFTPQFVLSPIAIASGDLNNNNRTDLVLSFGVLNFVAIMLDDGQGGVIQPTSFLDAGGRAVSLAISDLNGDNNADLVTANSNTSNISIFFGQGNGSFMPLVQMPVNANPKFVGVGDFNGDGKRDLIVTHDAPTAAVILLGNGSGSFAPPAGSPQPAVHDIAVGDFNNDGRTDVAAGNSPWNNVAIFLSDATGHLVLSSTTPSISLDTEMRLQVGNLNADSNLDLVVANVDRDTITVFLGNGTGGLSAGTNFAAGPRPLDLAMADFDGDTKLDVAVANNGGQHVSLFSGNGTGGLNSPVAYPGGVTPNGLAKGDFNQDSKPDLAVLSGTAFGVAILTNVVTPLPCLSVNDVTLTEGDAGSQNMNFVITLSQASLQPVRVNYSLVNNTATGGTDFTNISNRVLFAPGETTKTITVPILGDTIDEIDETFKIQLANPSNAAISDGEGQGTITDNDPLPSITINDHSLAEDALPFTRTFTVTLSSVSGKQVTVEYATANGTATAGTNPENGDDYFGVSGTLTIPAGQTSGQIIVSVFTDAMHEPDETFFLNLSNATNATISDAQGQATIVNDDPVPTVNLQDAFVFEGNTGTSDATFFVRLSNPTFQTVTLNFATATNTLSPPNTATAGTDYVAKSGSLSFAPGETEKQIVVLVNGDTVDELTELFDLEVSNVQNATVLVGKATAFIRDDDGPSVSINDVSIKEGNSGNTALQFTLTLSGPSVETIVVRATTASGTATQFNDFVGFNSNITFQPGQTTRTFNISLIGDTNPELDETFFVNLSQPNAVTIADGQGIGTILDDDTLRLALEEAGPVQPQAAAFDAWLFVRDPFRVKSSADWFNPLFTDRNTRVITFAENLQLNQGETASSVIVNLVDANNQSFDVPAEDVRAVPNVGLTQVLFRLPDNLAPGVCKVAIKAHAQTSNIGNIRIAP